MSDDAIPVDLRKRSAAERCLYLARRLGPSGDGDQLAVAITLDILAGEIKATAGKARDLADRWETAQLVHEDASAFIEAEPEWILGVVALLREMAASG